MHTCIHSHTGTHTHMLRYTCSFEVLCTNGWAKLNKKKKKGSVQGWCWCSTSLTQLSGYCFVKMERQKDMRRLASLMPQGKSETGLRLKKISLLGSQNCQVSHQLHHTRQLDIHLAHIEDFDSRSFQIVCVQLRARCCLRLRFWIANYKNADECLIIIAT